MAHKSDGDVPSERESAPGLVSSRVSDSPSMARSLPPTRASKSASRAVRRQGTRGKENVYIEPRDDGTFALMKPNADRARIARNRNPSAEWRVRWHRANGSNGGRPKKAS